MPIQKKQPETVPKTIVPKIEGQIGMNNVETKIHFQNPIARISFGKTALKPAAGVVIVSAPYRSKNGKTQEWSKNRGKWEFNRSENDSGKGKNGLVLIDEKGNIDFRHIDENSTGGSMPKLVSGQASIPSNILQAFTTIGIKIDGKIVNDVFKKADNGGSEKDGTTLTHYFGKKPNGEVSVLCFKNNETRGQIINKLQQYSDVVTLDYYRGEANGIQYNNGTIITQGQAFQNSGGYLMIKNK